MIFTLLLIDLFSYPDRWYIFNSVISLAGLLRVFSQRSTPRRLASSNNFSLNFVEEENMFCEFHPLPARVTHTPPAKCSLREFTFCERDKALLLGGYLKILNLGSLLLSECCTCYFESLKN